MKMTRPRSPRRAFTLIELLVVISIIGILMALLFPAVGSAIDSAKKAQAKNDAVQIANAVAAYELEYGRLPIFPSATGDKEQDVSGDLLKALMASETNNNARKIVFLEVQTAKRGKSGMTNNAFVDPWGHTYRIMLDGDYDNKLEKVGKTPGPTNDMVMRKVAVWNNVASKVTGETDAQAKRRGVGSWE